MIIVTLSRIDALPSYQRREHALRLLVSSHLVCIVFLIRFVHVCESRKTYLISTVLIFELVEVVFAPSDYVHWIVPILAHQIWALILAVVEIAASIWRYVLPLLLAVLDRSMTTILLWNHVISVVRIILWLLLTINQSNSAQVVFIVLLVLILAVISSHNQFLLCAFESDWTNWFVAIA